MPILIKIWMVALKTQENHQMMLSKNFVTDMEFNIGLMELIMRVSGVLIKPKVAELFGTLRAMYIEVNSRMIWQMDMENIHI